MSRQVKAAEFANAYEYAQAKKAERKADRTKRVSVTGRRAHQFQPSEVKGVALRG